MSLFHIPLSVSWLELRQSGKGGPKNSTDLSQQFMLPSPKWENWTKVQTPEKAHLAKVLVLVSWVTGVPTPSSCVPPSFYSIQHPGERRSSADIPNPHLHWHSAQRPWQRRYWYNVPHALALCSALELRLFLWKMFLAISRWKTAECAAGFKAEATEALFYLDVVLELNTKCIIWVSCNLPDDLISWVFLEEVLWKQKASQHRAVKPASLMKVQAMHRVSAPHESILGEPWTLSWGLSKQCKGVGSPSEHPWGAVDTLVGAEQAMHRVLAPHQSILGEPWTLS